MSGFADGLGAGVVSEDRFFSGFEIEQDGLDREKRGLRSGRVADIDQPVVMAGPAGENPGADFPIAVPVEIEHMDPGIGFAARAVIPCEADVAAVGGKTAGVVIVRPIAGGRLESQAPDAEVFTWRSKVLALRGCRRRDQCGDRDQNRNGNLRARGLHRFDSLFAGL